MMRAMITWLDETRCSQMALPGVHAYSTVRSNWFAYTQTRLRGLRDGDMLWQDGRREAALRPDTTALAVGAP
jgi:hypothetical protein